MYLWHSVSISVNAKSSPKHTYMIIWTSKCSYLTVTDIWCWQGENNGVLETKVYKIPHYRQLYRTTLLITEKNKDFCFCFVEKDKKAGMDIFGRKKTGISDDEEEEEEEEEGEEEVEKKEEETKGRTTKFQLFYFIYIIKCLPCIVFCHIWWHCKLILNPDQNAHLCSLVRVYTHLCHQFFSLLI